MKESIVRLRDEDRKLCEETIGIFRGGSQKARQTRILLPINDDGPNRTDRQIVDAISHHTVARTVQQTALLGTSRRSG